MLNMETIVRHKRSVRKIKCPDTWCEGHKHEICIDDEIDLGNYGKISDNLGYIECPYCGNEILIKF